MIALSRSALMRIDRTPDHLARLGYRAAMERGKAWVVLNAARAIEPRTHPLDAKHYFHVSVRHGIVFG